MILLSPDEKIILVVRKHWFIFFSQGLVIAFFVILPFIAYPFASRVILLPDGGTFLLFIFFSSLWLLGAWLAFFILWTNNYLDMLIVTNRRVIDVEQITLFHREISSFGLDKIQDITVETRGMLASMVHFGNIQIQTAGEAKELRLDSIGEPEKIRQAISEAVTAYRPLNQIPQSP